MSLSTLRKNCLYSACQLHLWALRLLPPGAGKRTASDGCWPGKLVGPCFGWTAAVLAAMQAVFRTCRCWYVLGLCSSSLSGGVGPVSSKGFSYTLSLRFPLPGYFLPCGKLNCGVLLEMPGAAPLLSIIHTGNTLPPYAASLWTSSVLPGSCLRHVRSSVDDALVCAGLPQIIQWLLLVSGLMS